MKRFLCVVLAFIITVGCVPCLAAEAAEPAFSDVPDDAWYAPYVEVCVEAGVMRGVGGGRFAPESYLTQEESLVLLMRLYDLLQGGDGEFLDPPPEAWGTYRLTYEDGTSLLLTSGQMGGVGTHSGSWYTAALSPGDRAIAEAHLEQSATLTDLGTGASFDALTFFQPEWAEDTDLQISGGHFPGYYISDYKREWYGNVLWYALEKGFLDSARNSGVKLVAMSAGYDSVTQRNEFAAALADVAGELEQINPTPALLMDRQYHDGVYRIYEAGIMTQLNSSGDVDFNRFYSPITRAEAATMVARVLKPALRARFSLPGSET